MPPMPQYQTLHVVSPVSLHLELLLGERPVPDDELGVGWLLAGLEPPLRQPHARLQLVVEDAAVAQHEEEVLLVALRRLALHVPVVFPVEDENGGL